MTLSVLDPVPALLVIDLQKGLMDRPTAHPLTEVVVRTARLAAAFRRHGHPVALVVATGVPPGRREVVRVSVPTTPGWTDPVDELGAQASDLRITKQRPGAFTATSLDASLRSLGVTQVVVTGIATGAGVEATARSAYELGYHVVVAVDAVTDPDAEAHAHSVGRVFPRIGETTTSEALLAALETAHS